MAFLLRSAARAARNPHLMKPKDMAVRSLNLHEYQSKILMDKYNVMTQKGKEATSEAEAKAACDWIKEENTDAELILKAQIHAGGRGKGHFLGGLKGGVKVCTTTDEVVGYVPQMIGDTLVTHQTGPEGQKCGTVLINEGLDILSETYFAILMDRAYNGPVMVASAQGGMDIEEVAESDPDAILTEPIDIMKGVQPEQTRRLAEALGFEGELIPKAQEQMSNLYDLFMGTDATQVEINPFAVGKYVGREGATGVYCVDAKLNFDDNSAYRQKEVYDMRDTSMEDARDVEAEEIGVQYIGLDGNIACLVNGAGLAMATMDIIKLHGGEPANFCDLGGGVNTAQVTAAFKLVKSDPNVKAILVNIFGGIVQCDTVANGIAEAAKAVDLDLPLIVRLEGTNVDAGKKILEDSGVNLATAIDLDDAAKKAVASLA